MTELRSVELAFEDLPSSPRDVIPDGAEKFGNGFGVHSTPEHGFWVKQSVVGRGDTVGVHWQSGFLGKITIAMGREKIDSVDAEGTFGRFEYEPFREADHILHITDSDEGNWPNLLIWVES